MAEMLFRFVDGQPIPLAPAVVEQQLLKADDQDVFNIDGIERRSGWGHESLVTLHELAWPAGEPASADLILAEQDALIQSLADWRKDPDKVLIRQRDFDRLNDEELAFFLAKCRQRKINPWAGQAIPEFRWNRHKKRQEVVIILPIGSKRSIAHSTGTYAGIGRANFEYGDESRPLSCWISIRRVVDGSPCEFVGEALWADYYPGPNTDTLWDQKPHVCLATCAESNGLTRAFPERLSDVYTAPEFSKGPKGGQSSPNEMSTDLPPSAELPDSDMPATFMGLHRSLMDLGLGTLPARDVVIKDFERQFPGLWERDELGFYAKIITAAKSDPRRWGAQAG